MIQVPPGVVSYCTESPYTARNICPTLRKISPAISPARWGFSRKEPHFLYGRRMLNTSSALPNTPPPIIRPNRYALSGKLKCGCCGNTYVGGDNRKRKDGTIRKTWKCAEKHKYGRKHLNAQGENIGCDNDNVNNDIVLNAFNQIMTKITSSDKEYIIKSTMKTISLVLKNNCSLNTDEERLYQKKQKIETQIKKAISLCISGIITDEELKEQKVNLENELTLINKDLDKINEKQILLQNKDQLLDIIEKTLNEILSFETTSDELCKQVLEKVIIKSKNEFDFYIKGYKAPFFKNYKSAILETIYLYHLILL